MSLTASSVAALSPASRRLWTVMVAMLLALLAAPGQARGQDLSVTYGRTEIDDGGTYSFGETRQGRPVSRNFVIRNTSGQTLTLANPVITGQGFTARLTRTFLRPGKKTRLAIRMDPAAAGSRSALVQLPALGSFGAPFSFTINGEVVSPRPRMRVSGRSGTLVSGDDVFLGFARTGQNVVQQFTIRNGGQQQLNISDVTLEGSGFQLLSQPGNSIKPGKFTRFTVRMDTGAAGSPQAVARFTTNDPDAPTFELMLSGSVAPDGPNMQVIGAGAFLSSGGTVDFGSLDAGSSRIENFTIRNRGNEPLTIGQVTVTGAGFEALVQPATSLAPGASTQFLVQFESSVGDSSGTLTIPNNTEGSEDYVLHLTGAGEPAPAIEVYSGDTQIQRFGVFPFGSGFTGNFIVGDFIIRNAGSETLAIIGVSAGGDYEINEQPADSMLEPGEETSFVVVVTLGACGPEMGDVAGEIIINNNDPNDSPFRFTVTAFNLSCLGGGEPLRPAIDAQDDLIAIDVEGEYVAPHSVVSFGAAEDGEDLERFFTITNGGRSAITLGEPSIVGVGFRLGDAPPSRIEPGEEGGFSLILDGARHGRAAALIVIPVVGADEPLVFMVEGESGPG